MERAQFRNRTDVVFHLRESSTSTRISAPQLRTTEPQSDADLAVLPGSLPLLRVAVRHSPPCPCLAICRCDSNRLSVVGHCLLVLLQVVVGYCSFYPYCPHLWIGVNSVREVYQGTLWLAEIPDSDTAV